MKRFSPLLILGALAALLFLRKKDEVVVAPDSVWTPVEPS